MSRLHALLALLLLPVAACASGGGSLFDPTPDARLRPLSADRPDATESPYTVDAGRAQLELEIASYLADDEGGVETEEWLFGGANVKLGLTSRVDLQLVFDVFTEVETRSGGARSTANGFGDLQVRGKFNLWGNDGGETAFAIMPFLEFPTADSSLGGDDLEGGVIAPLATDLGGGWGFGTQLELDAVRNAADDGYDLDVAHTIVVGRELTDRLGAFVELASVLPGDGRDWIGTLNGGFTFSLGKNAMLDIGTNVGLNDEAPDLRVFAGFTRRF